MTTTTTRGRCAATIASVACAWTIVATARCDQTTGGPGERRLAPATCPAGAEPGGPAPAWLQERPASQPTPLGPAGTPRGGIDPASASSDQLYAAGRARLKAGDTQAATRLLSAALAKSPQRADCALGLAEAYAQAGQRDSAIRLLKNHRAFAPDNVELRMALARLYTDGAAWKEAESVLAADEAALEPAAVLLLAEARAQAASPEAAVATLQRALERLPRDESLWLALIERALRQQQPALALRWVEQAAGSVGYTPALCFEAARAYFALGQALGEAQVRRVPGGHVGQFAGDWLLVEQRPELERFLCCPRESAIYQVRRALDGGLEQGAAYVLYARLWGRLGKPELGLAVLQAREALLLGEPGSEALQTLQELALAAGAVEDFLRYARLRAQRDVRHQDDILYEASLAAADRYGQRGDALMHRELLRRGLALRATDVERMLELADALWDAGQRDEARGWYRRVLERVPQHAMRGRVLERLGE